MENKLTVKKPRILCLHGHGSSGADLKKKMGKWPSFVLEKMDIVFINAPFLLQAKSDENDDDDQPSFGWYNNTPNQLDESFDECITYIEDCMVKFGPFDGVLGMSEGAVVTAALPGIQAMGVALKKVEKIKFVMVISGAKLGGFRFAAPRMAKNAFSSPIEISSLHCFGEHDFAKPTAIELLGCFINPFVIYHHGGHEIPKLDENGLKVMLSFLNKIQMLVQKIQSSL